MHILAYNWLKMDTALRTKVTEVLAKYNFSKEDAAFMTEVLHGIDERQKREFEAKMDLLLTQKDKTELIDRMQKDKTELIDRIQRVETSLTKQIYIVGLIQFLAIVASVIGIINFMLK